MPHVLVATTTLCVMTKADHRRRYGEMTRPLIDFYQQANSLQSFVGTESDTIYAAVKKMLSAELAG